MLELADTVIGTIELLLVFLSVTPPFATLGFNLIFRLNVMVGFVLILIFEVPLPGLKDADKAVVEEFAVVKDQLYAAVVSPLPSMVKASSGKETVYTALYCNNVGGVSVIESTYVDSVTVTSFLSVTPPALVEIVYICVPLVLIFAPGTLICSLVSTGTFVVPFAGITVGAGAVPLAALATSSPHVPTSTFNIIVNTIHNESCFFIFAFPFPGCNHVCKVSK